MQQYWYDRSKPFGTVLGHAGGIGPFATPKGPEPLTRAEIQELESAGRPMPHGFTGLWRGKHYYRGRQWTGPTNAMGAK